MAKTGSEHSFQTQALLGPHLETIDAICAATGWKISRVTQVLIEAGFASARALSPGTLEDLITIDQVLARRAAAEPSAKAVGR